MSRLYAECQNLAEWLKETDDNDKQEIILQLVDSINALKAKEKNSIETMGYVAERMPSVVEYLSKQLLPND